MHPSIRAIPLIGIINFEPKFGVGSVPTPPIPMNINPTISNQQSATLNVLLIGYGNTLRSDDGVGQIVAKAVKQWNLPNVRSQIVHQLTPELAPTLAHVDVAIFVDAYQAVFEPQVKVCFLEPADSSMLMGHSSDPKALLAIAQTLYNHCPQAWLVAIPGQNFELGESLSPVAEQGLEEALTLIKRMIQTDLASFRLPALNPPKIEE